MGEIDLARIFDQSAARRAQTAADKRARDAKLRELDARANALTEERDEIMRAVKDGSISADVAGVRLRDLKARTDELTAQLDATSRALDAETKRGAESLATRLATATRACAAHLVEHDHLAAVVDQSGTFLATAEGADQRALRHVAREDVTDRVLRCVDAQR